MVNDSTQLKYRDRAVERRNHSVGDSAHLENNDLSKRASVNVEIDEQNVGRKMLQKMGWRQGQGLGKNEEGIIEPVRKIIL